MPACVAPDTLGRYLAEALPAAEDAAVAAHLAGCPGCRAALAALLRTPPPDDLPAVPGYELRGVVGEGGMGVVYRARDVKLDREVAVKVVRLGVAAPAVADRLAAEARVTAALGEHPGIVPVTDAGVLPDGRAYFVMKFVAGRTFAARLAEPDRAFAADADLRVVERAARIAGYAHTHPRGGLVHRDLKPSNVLLSTFDEVFVADWGLSKWYAPAGGSDGPAGGVTTAGHGTWAYMPPEQAAPGPGRPIGAASDVFALGGVLAEVLTGQPTYTADAPAKVVARAKAADLGETHARLAAAPAAPELVKLCRACLAPDPADRPADGTAVADALVEYFAGRDARVRAADLAAAEAGARADAERRRRRTQLALVAAVGLLVVGAGVAAWAWDGQRRADRDRAARTADALATLLDRAEDDLRRGAAADAASSLAAAAARAAEDGLPDPAGRLARLRADLALLEDLDAVDAFRWTAGRGRLPEPGNVADRWVTALGRHGLGVGAAPADEVAARVTASAARPAVLAALDGALARRPDPAVRAVLAAADPDPFRDGVRDRLAADDRAAFPALAAQTKWEEQPSGFVRAFVAAPGLPVDTRRALLARVVAARPADFGLVMELGRSYPGGRAAGAADRARYFQAAVGLRPGNVAAWTNLGGALADARDLDGALRAAREAARLAPDQGLVAANVGVALAARKDWDAARAALREAIRLDPAHAPAYQVLAVVLASSGALPAAHAACQDALRADPSSAAVYVTLGQLHEAEGRLADATAAYREAVRLDPTHPTARMNLGVAVAKAGDFAGAVVAFREAVRVDPENARAHANLALALRDTNDPPAAVAAGREAVRLDPADPLGHLHLGIALSAHGEPDAAIACYREAARLDPRNVTAFTNLGELLRTRGRMAEAAEAYRAAAALAPLNPRPPAGLGHSLAGRDPTAAAEAYRTAIRLGTRDPAVFQQLGLIHRAGGRPDEAVELLRESVRLGPADPAFRNVLALGLFEAGAVEEAEREAVALVRDAPKLADAHNTLGVVKAARGDLAAAAAAFRSATELDPRNANAFNNLGTTFARAGEWDEAIACFRVAVALAPGHASARDNLAQARARLAPPRPVAPPPRPVSR